MIKYGESNASFDGYLLRAYQHDVDQTDIRAERSVSGEEIPGKSGGTSEALGDECSFLVGCIVTRRVPLTCGRQRMECSAVRGDGFGLGIMSQHMDLMTTALQLARQSTLGWEVSAAVPINHQHAQRVGRRGA